MFVYYMVHDDGAAPCTQDALTTLAICKKDIRLHARSGDVIVGLMSKQLGALCQRAAGTMVWCGTVDRKLTLQDYYSEFRGRHDCIYTDELRHITEGDVADVVHDCLRIILNNGSHSFNLISH